MSEDVRERVRVHPRMSDVVRTKQSFKDDCDINVIMDRHTKTGVVNHLNRALPQYGDFSEANGLKDAMDRVFAAEQLFAGLESRIRKAAANSPHQMLQMLATEDGAYALQEAGLDLGLPSREPAPLGPVGAPPGAPADPPAADAGPVPPAPDTVPT